MSQTLSVKMSLTRIILSIANYMTLSLLFLACAQEQDSALKDVLNSEDNIIYYRTTSAAGDFIARRRCAKHMPKPTRNCPSYDEVNKKELEALTLVKVRQFSMNFAGLTVEDEKFLGEEGGLVLADKIAGMEKFLLRPQITESDIAAGKGRLSSLLRLQQRLKHLNAILNEISNGSSELPNFSEDYKAIVAAFRESYKTPGAGFTYDRGNNIWWAYLGMRNFYDATGEARPTTRLVFDPNPQGPVLSSCQQEFGQGYRLPSVNELAKATTQGHLLIHDVILNGWSDNGYFASNFRRRPYATDGNPRGNTRLTYCVISAN